ncbi:translation initiation factor eIF-2B subunit epsilon-like protein [Trifolium pratense]|uniref:Translation initiation factor eIF-2B subunit epsilon-like protein n=1 Tax=Trifolium pratense TaxID=57577 RepID=A0A2K3KQL2_TRIPR|nr:translation initiation factor eIF-2B subunit epsilon-like protein [Trifolium pratense]
MYNEDIIEEDAILSWEDEKKEADESDKVFVKQAQTFIQWLKEPPEEDDDEEE